MAATTYRVKLTKQAASFNANETIWASAPLGQALVDLGLAVPVDALPPRPSGTAAPPAGTNVRAVVHRGTIAPLIGSQADRDLLQNEAGMWGAA